MRTNSRQTQLFSLRDFTGGLNLTTDAFKLAENESPDAQNVDFDRRGGFTLRRGVTPYSNTALSAAPNAVWLYNSSGTVYTMVQIGAIVYYGTGTTWTALGSNLGSSTQTVEAVTFNNNSYWVRGNANVVRSAGLTPTELNSSVAFAFNDTGTPTSGNVPRAEHIAVHSGFLWVANTWESGTNYPNRIRWSWANTFDNSGENWRVNDYIDIDEGKDSDKITAIVPHGDQLIVFKRNSVYVVYGYSKDSFSVVNVSNTVGAVSNAATVNTPAGLFFFDYKNGINVYDRASVKPMFTQIFPALRDGDIPAGSIDNVQIGWINNRLWVSVPWTDVSTPPRGMTFVLDPFLKSGGSWTKYTLQLGPYATGGRIDDSLAYIYGTNRIFKLDVIDQYYDNLGTGSTNVTIDAYYRTRFIDLGEPALKKHWRRTDILMQVAQGYTLPVVSYSNYDPTIPIKNFSFSSVASASSATKGIWDNAASDWDLASWSKSGVYDYMDRGSPLGVARSVSLKIGGKVLTNPATGSTQASTFWGVDALIFKYVPRRIR